MEKMIQHGFVKTGKVIRESLSLLLSEEDVTKLCESVMEDHEFLTSEKQSKSEASTAKNSPEHQNLKSPSEAFNDSTPIGGEDRPFPSPLCAQLRQNNNGKC
jgi:hypothetical protein